MGSRTSNSKGGENDLQLFERNLEQAIGESLHDPILTKLSTPMDAEMILAKLLVMATTKKLPKRSETKHDVKS